MAKNQISTRISPEGLEIANAYLELGNIPAVCARLSIDEAKASEYLAKREVRAYVDQVYLDTGYRNRFKLAETLDTLIDAKLAEAEKNTPIVQNITYNITDSAISGDITNKINQDD